MQILNYDVWQYNVNVSLRYVFANQLDRSTLCTFPFRLFETEDEKRA